MPKALSLIPYKIFPAKLGGQKGIALFNEYLSKVFPLLAVTVKSNDPKFASYPVFNVLSNAASRYANPLNYFRIKKIIRSEGITHLILEHPYFGWLGILLKKFTGVRLVVHSHNIESTRWKTLNKWWWRILWRYEGMVHRKADYNFFIHDDDREYAIRQYRADPEKCITVTYGIEWKSAPLASERKEARSILLDRYSLDPAVSLLLFNGSLNYFPNLKAVKDILERLNPMLLTSKISYRILICGSGLPPEMNELKEYQDRNIIYAGFVDDISLYFKGADIFLNPLLEGGGIKTKLVEALGYGTRAVSTENGSIGVSAKDCGGLLTIVADNDWSAFANAVTLLTGQPELPVPLSFFEKFYWGNIARKAANFINA